MEILWPCYRFMIYENRCVVLKVACIISTVLCFGERFFSIPIEQFLSELTYLTQTAKSDETEPKDFHQIWN